MSTTIFTHQTSRTTYTISLQHLPDSTTISLQDKCAVELWSATFDPPYVQKLTAKAGSQLSYQRWYEVLTLALSKKDLSCYVDVLTSQDLDKLRGKKKSTQVDARAGKRYLILTLMENQTRSHFPMPLKASTPKRSIEELRKIYMQLQNPVYQQNLSIKSKRFVEIEQCRAENEILKQKLKRLQSKDASPDIDVEKEVLSRQADKVQAQLNASIQTLERKEFQLTVQLETSRTQMNRLRAKLIADDAKASRQQADNERELAKCKQESSRVERDTDRLKNEIEASKKRQKQQQTKIKQLQAQYDATRKQKFGGRGNSPYSVAGGSIKSKSMNSSGSNKSKPRSLNRY